MQHSELPKTIVIGGRDIAISVDMSVARQLDAFVEFLHHYDRFEPAFAAAIKSSYQDHSALLCDLEQGLKSSTWQALFPGCKTASDVTATKFFQATTLCGIHLWKDDDDGEMIVADYRFCVEKVSESELKGLQFGELIDVTDQVIAVKAKLDGTVLRVDHES
ncbi:MAG: hypothetical protein RLZZ618_181 [Pseudomonadota bacterium]